MHSPAAALRDIQERGRTLESVAEQYQATVRPMHEQFVDHRAHAQLIVPWLFHNEEADPRAARPNRRTVGGRAGSSLTCQGGTPRWQQPDERGRRQSHQGGRDIRGQLDAVLSIAGRIECR